jgi:hypothetical protein
VVLLSAICELRWEEEATRRELEVVKRERDAAIRHKEEALRELRSREEATRRAEAALGARDEATRSKDAQIARLCSLVYGVEVLDVDAGVSRVVEEAGAGAEKRILLEQAAGARVVGALQERLVAVKKEQVVKMIMLIFVSAGLNGGIVLKERVFSLCHPRCRKCFHQT